MAYTTGTCVGHLALLDALKAFLEAQGWETKRYTTGDVYEYIAMGPGLTGTDEIYVGIQTYTDSDNQYYNWKLRGYTGYSSLLDFASQPGALYQSDGNYGPGLLLTNGTIQYWLVCDGRRVIIVAKCSTSYNCAYLGLLNPYGPSSQFPYPLYIGGNTNFLAVNSDLYTYNYSFFSPYTYDGSHSLGCYLLCGYSWLSVVNNVTSNTNSVFEFTLHTHPYFIGSSTNNCGLGFFRENLDGSYPLFPIILYSGRYNSTKAIYGELSGVYAIPKWENLPEDTLTIDGVDYLVIQRSKSTSAESLAALKLV